MAGFSLSDEQVDRLNGWARNDPNFTSTFPYAPSNGRGFGDYLKGLEDSIMAGALPLAVQLDEVGGNVTYVGEAEPGTLPSEAKWRIKKIDESGNPELIITWASGSREFDKVWDSRLSYIYT